MSRPNILFIMTDQQRWDCLGANGNRIIQTPNLDRLAERSANFSHAFVQAPVCVPSRASFFTGRYPHAHRNRVNYTPLDPREILMQARLRDGGYRTAVVGKLHYYPATPEEARRTGFDIVELHDGVRFCDEWSDYAKWRNANDPRKDVYYRALAKDIEPGRNPFRQATDERYTDTTWVGLRTRHHLRELAKDAKPFFLFSSFWKPHGGYETPVPFDRMYDGVEIPLPPPMTLDDMHKLPPPLQALFLRGPKPEYPMDRERLQWLYRGYYGSISHVDREVGLILETLEQSGRVQDTLIVFCSDHGDQMLEHGILGKNCFFEGSVRIPFTIACPDVVKPGRYDDLIETIDLLPTLFDFAGLPEPYACQGRSFARRISDAGQDYRPRDAVFCENVIPEVITSGKFDFSFEKGKGIKGTRHPDAKMVRTRRWKYNYYPEGYAELYDLEHDPGERLNLNGDPKYRDVVAEMKDRLLHWLTTAGETDQIAPRWLIS